MYIQLSKQPSPLTWNRSILCFKLKMKANTSSLQGTTMQAMEKKIVIENSKWEISHFPSRKMIQVGLNVSRTPYCNCFKMGGEIVLGKKIYFNGQTIIQKAYLQMWLIYTLRWQHDSFEQFNWSQDSSFKLDLYEWLIKYRGQHTGI